MNYKRLVKDLRDTL